MTPIIWTSPALTQPRGRQLAVSWSQFADRAACARSAASKDMLARWAPVEFKAAYRSMANVLRAHAVVVDVDDGSVLDTVVSAIDDLFAIVHSTFSATETIPRWRIIVPTDRPMEIAEYERVWRWLAMRLEAASVLPDFGARDASRAWAVPARPPSDFYISTVVGGAIASSEAALLTVPKAEPVPEPERRVDEPYARRMERGARYLARMPGGIQGSGGSTTTMRAAVAMVRGFALEPADALRLLVEIHNPLCQPGWSSRELKHKVTQAHRRGRLPFGAIVERGRVA